VPNYIKPVSREAAVAYCDEMQTLSVDKRSAERYNFYASDIVSVPCIKFDGYKDYESTAKLRVRVI
jgi:hypothetical protein